MQSLVENCFNKASNNPDKFAECVASGQNKSSALNEAFQFKMVFLTRSVQQCLSNRNPADKCEQDGIKVGRDIVENLIKQIDKL